jgi:cysteine desulfurase/selenocysteine lyase
MLAKRTGAKLKTIPIDDDGNLIPDQLENLISNKTILISVTYVSNVLGVINPIEKIIQKAHAHNVPVMIDAAQAIQHIHIDVQNLGCDFMAFSGHKMYAETGIGVLYGKKKWLESLEPPVYGGGMVKQVDIHQATFLEPPQKFEAGTCNVSGAVSLAAAIEYMEKTGLTNIAMHEKKVYEYTLQQLQADQDITIYGNTNNSCGALAFNLNNIHPYDVGAILDKMGIAVRTGHHCADPLMNRLKIDGAVRASFGMYNTKEEIDALIKGIEKAKKILT